MKKVLFIFFLCLFFIRFNNNQTELVYLEYDDIYNKYIIDVSTCNINTKNINKKFERFNIKILALYPYIEKYYEKLLGEKLAYFYINDINNLSLFNKYYFKLLEQLGLNNYKNNVLTEGIKINKMIIYTKYNSFNNLKLQYNCVKKIR